MDEHVRATVERGGSIQRTQRPTLTRMAIGSVLPGTALIPGFATRKTTVHDDRELHLVIEHPEWARLMKLDPSFGHQARAVAVAINQAANELKAKRVSRRSGPRSRNRCAGGGVRRRHGRAALEAAQRRSAL